jgi:hypothetical protein
VLLDIQQEFDVSDIVSIVPIIGSYIKCILIPGCTAMYSTYLYDIMM